MGIWEEEGLNLKQSKDIWPDFAHYMAEIEVYSHLILHKIIECLRRLHGEGDTHERRPTIYDILHKLISRFDQRTFEGANLHPALYLAFARFLQMTLQEDRLLLVLPSSKTDPFRRQMTLTISAARDEACVVKSLRNFFERFPKSHYHPLFSTSAGTFNRTYVTRKLQEGIRILGYGGNCTGHLFRRGAATSARLLEEKIQLLADTREHNLPHHEYPLQAPPPPRFLHVPNPTTKSGLFYASGRVGHNHGVQVQRISFNPHSHTNTACQRFYFTFSPLIIPLLQCRELHVLFVAT